MSTKKMRLDDVRVSHLLQSRSGGLNNDTVQEYAMAMRRGVQFPPLVAYRISDQPFKKPSLVAGFHRHAAYKLANVAECEVEVRTGTFAEAWLASWVSNLTHGLRYTNLDKRKATETALKLWRTDSAVVIAERIAVSDEYVRKVRKNLIAVKELEPVETVTRRNGKSYPSQIEQPAPLPPQCPTVGHSEPQKEEPVTASPEPESQLPPVGYTKAVRAEQVLDAFAKVQVNVKVAEGSTGEQTVSYVRMVEREREQEGEIPTRRPVPASPTTGDPVADARAFLQRVRGLRADASGDVCVSQLDAVAVVERLMVALEAKHRAEAAGEEVMPEVEAAELSPEDAERAQKQKARALEAAAEAINCLKKIRRDNPGRARAFEKVRSFVKANS